MWAPIFPLSFSYIVRVFKNEINSKKNLYKCLQLYRILLPFPTIFLSYEKKNCTSVYQCNKKSQICGGCDARVHNFFHLPIHDSIYLFVNKIYTCKIHTPEAFCQDLLAIFKNRTDNSGRIKIWFHLICNASSPHVNKSHRNARVYSSSEL